MIGYIILALTLAAFVGLGGYGLVRYLRGRDQWEWPDEPRTVGEYQGVRAHLSAYPELDLGLPHADVARLCALAAGCVADVATVRVPEVCVHVLADREYDRVYSPGSNGELHTLRTRSGNRSMPLIVCRFSAFGSTLKTGSLVVHELVHWAQDALTELPTDDHHLTPDWWLPAQDSYEARAQAEFVRLRGVANPK